jgi:hypothetical protein
MRFYPHLLCLAVVSAGCSKDPREERVTIFEDFIAELEGEQGDCDAMRKDAAEFAKDNAEKFKELEKRAATLRASEKAEGKTQADKDQVYEERLDKAMQRLEAPEIQKCNQDGAIEKALAELLGA